MFLVAWPGGSWEATVRMSVTVLVLYMAIVWVALIFWVYRDIRQRTRDPIVQTVAILLVLFFFLPGHWIYLILRPRYTLNELYERSLEEEAILQDLEDQKACPHVPPSRPRRLPDVPFVQDGAEGTVPQLLKAAELRVAHLPVLWDREAPTGQAGAGATRFAGAASPGDADARARSGLPCTASTSAVSTERGRALAHDWGLIRDAVSY